MKMDRRAPLLQSGIFSSLCSSELCFSLSHVPVSSPSTMSLQLYQQRLSASLGSLCCSLEYHLAWPRQRFMLIYSSLVLVESLHSSWTSIFSRHIFFLFFFFQWVVLLRKNEGGRDLSHCCSKMQIASCYSVCFKRTRSKSPFPSSSDFYLPWDTFSSKGRF